MKIKNGYMLKKVMGSYMIISTEENTNNMQTLNETGAFLWGLLEKDTTVEKMADAMVKEYEVDLATAKADIEAFITKVEKSGLLEK